MMFSSFRWGLAVAGLLLLGLSACQADTMGSGGAPLADSTEADRAGGAAYAGEVFLRGELVDTLRGGAAFGRILDTRTGREKFVIALTSASDVSSGLYLVRSRPEPPPPGTYELVTYPDADSVAYEGFAIVYREGMRRRLTSADGAVRLTSVRDTLIEGSFEATLEGVVAPPGERMREISLNARGSFRARDGSVGYIMGL